MSGDNLEVSFRAGHPVSGSHIVSPDNTLFLRKTHCEGEGEARGATAPAARPSGKTDTRKQGADRRTGYKSDPVREEKSNAILRNMQLIVDAKSYRTLSV